MLLLKVNAITLISFLIASSECWIDDAEHLSNALATGLGDAADSLAFVNRATAQIYSILKFGAPVGSFLMTVLNTIVPSESKDGMALKELNLSLHREFRNVQHSLRGICHQIKAHSSKLSYNALVVVKTKTLNAAVLRWLSPTSDRNEIERQMIFNGCFDSSSGIDAILSALEVFTTECAKMPSAELHAKSRALLRRFIKAGGVGGRIGSQLYEDQHFELMHVLEAAAFVRSWTLEYAAERIWEKAKQNLNVSMIESARNFYNGKIFEEGCLIKQIIDCDKFKNVNVLGLINSVAIVLRQLAFCSSICYPIRFRGKELENQLALFGNKAREILEYIERYSTEALSESWGVLEKELIEEGMTVNEDERIQEVAYKLFAKLNGVGSPKYDRVIFVVNTRESGITYISAGVFCDIRFCNWVHTDEFFAVSVRHISGERLEERMGQLLDYFDEIRYPLGNATYDGHSISTPKQLVNYIKATRSIDLEQRVYYSTALIVREGSFFRLSECEANVGVGRDESKPKPFASLKTMYPGTFWTDKINTRITFVA